MFDPTPEPMDEAAQAELIRQMNAALAATGSVPADDPRRHLRVRLRAAQLLTHAMRGADGADGMRLAWDAAVAEFGTGIALFGSVVGLVAEYADHDTLTRSLQAEIARVSLQLEDVRMDGK